MSENEPSLAGDKLRAANPPKFQDKNALLEQRKHGSKIFPIDCHHWDSANGASYNVWHWHPETEIVHAIEGKNLEVYFADRVYTFTAPAIVLIPGGVMHRNNFLGQSNTLNALADGSIALIEPILRGDPGFEQMNMLLNFLDRFAKYKEAGMRLQLKGALIQIIGVLYQYGYLNKKPIRRAKRGTSREERIKDLFNYISANYNHPLSIVDVSARLNISKQYFCRFFKNLTGMSFVNYLNVIRLNHAVQEILLTTDPINDIAERNGFDSISYFFKLFKQNFHCTPNIFRQKKGTQNFEPVDLTILDLHQRVTAAHPELLDIPATTAHGNPRAQAQDVDPVDLADTTDLAAIEVATEAD